MLGDAIRKARKEKGLSQEELAAKLHVVRQTVSKWESGTSVPDADLLIGLAKALDTTVGALLGEDVSAAGDPFDALASEEKTDALNARFAALCEARRKRRSCFFILLLVVSALFLAVGAAFTLRPYGVPADASAALIGGANGPTAILVASSPSRISRLLLPLLGMAISVTGILLNRRK